MIFQLCLTSLHLLIVYALWLYFPEIYCGCCEMNTLPNWWISKSKRKILPVGVQMIVFLPDCLQSINSGSPCPMSLLSELFVRFSAPILLLLRQACLRIGTSGRNLVMEAGIIWIVHFRNHVFAILDLAALWSNFPYTISCLDKLSSSGRLEIEFHPPSYRRCF